MRVVLNTCVGNSLNTFGPSFFPVFCKFFFCSTAWQKKNCGKLRPQKKKTEKKPGKNRKKNRSQKKQKKTGHEKKKNTDRKKKKIQKEVLRAKLVRGELLVGNRPDLFCGGFTEDEIAIEVALELKVRPMVQWIANRLRDGARPCHEALFGVAVLPRD